MLYTLIFLGCAVAFAVWIAYKLLKDEPQSQVDISSHYPIPAKLVEEEQERVQANVPVDSTPMPARLDIPFGQIFWPVFWAIICATAAMGIVVAIVRAIN